MSLFSAVSASVLAVTIPDLKQNPQATSAFYLENMYKLQALASSDASPPVTLAQSRFSPPQYAVWVNIFLFTSLCIDIFTAFMALWIRGRMRRYLVDTESPHISPHYRARMHEILVSEFYHSLAFIPLVVMLWLSPLLFFAGLSVYLFNVNRVVFGAVIGVIGLCFIAFFRVLYWLDKVSASYRVHFSLVVYAEVKPDSFFLGSV
jgi:Family of unknown function (DUF6535)